MPAQDPREGREHLLTNTSEEHLAAGTACVIGLDRGLRVGLGLRDGFLLVLPKARDEVAPSRFS